ncbi:sensor histidine kinase [Pedobacter metabolipauper]|uniref:Histidine kinase n=1 Tax=Pedobacter metabolipauper TaxID=425513 RepID=A0A4R6SXX7_9SPHI|nr:histidine kinase [Pedobacter metabolipauper]TDQ11256.1 histidine kinase [Pedobacter metabolipauper]
MKRKRYLPALFFISYFSCVYGQQSNESAPSYLHFEAAGLPGNQIKEISQGKNVTVYTVGGSLNIYPTSALHNMYPKFYTRAYFKQSNFYGKPAQSKITEFALKGNSSSIYLLPAQEASVDILDKNTNTLLTRYIIKRPGMIPEIKLRSQKDKSSQPLHISSSADHKGELSLSPGEPLEIDVAARTDFKDLEVEYTLVNLKTKRSEYQISKTGFKPLKLAANTEYEWRFNYVLQKESVRLIYIRVKPYWYQSTITYMVLLIVFVATGFLLVTLFFKNKLKSSEKKQQKMEAAAIRLQSLLNPHFTFNALSSIQGLMNTDRIDEANQYLQEFSFLLRKTLANSQHVFNSLDQELEMMRTYIHLEALRFNFSWNIEISAKLSTSDIEIPTLLLQPLIENAIKHGLSPLGDKGQLFIVCKPGQKKDTFVIVVGDNGTWLDKKSDSGYGLSLTAERILAINKIKEEQAIVLDFNKESGTEAILTFHNWINN